MAVTRTGPPEVVDLQGTTLRIRVPLNGRPQSAEWQHLFFNPMGFSTMHHPRMVDFVGDALEFDSDENGVEDWLRFVDSWLKSANERYAQYLAGLEQKRAARAQEESDHQKHLREANERLRAKFEKGSS